MTRQLFRPVSRPPIKTLVHFLAATLLVLLPASSGAKAQVAPQEVAVNFLTSGEPETLDPNRASPAAGAYGAVVRQVFEPLLRFDDKLIPRPAAADSYEVSADGTLYTFHLRRDAQWSDGQPVTAQQFAFSWKRLLDPRLKADYAPLFVDAGIVGADDYNARRVATPDRVGIRATDDYTLEIRLSQPFGALPALAALSVGAPLRPDLVGADAEGWAQDPSTYIGNGPFMLSDWVHQDHLTLVPNPHYVAHASWPRPALSQVTVSMAADPEDDFAAFKANQRDWIVVPDAEVNAVLNDPDLAAQARQYADLTTFWVQVNTAQPPLDDVLVRRALARGIDRIALARDLTGGLSMPTTSVLPPGMPGFEVGLGHELSFDAAGGRALLAQAGHGSERPLSFSFPATPANLRRAEFLQAQWHANLGLQVELNLMEASDYEQALEDGQYDLALGGWSADYPDPQDWFSAVFTCQGAFNRTSYCNSSLDRLIARADTSSSLEDRLSLYRQAQMTLTQQVPVLPLFVRGHLALVKPWVQSTDGGPLPITPADDYPGTLNLDRVQILPH
jgi:oligopeptide transport system substrate-binding protein